MFGGFWSLCINGLTKFNTYDTTQTSFTCSKLTIETVERGCSKLIIIGITSDHYFTPPSSVFIVKGTLMQIWKSANIFVFIWKWYAEELTLKHLLLSEICARGMCEKFVYKHSKKIEYVKN